MSNALFLLLQILATFAFSALAAFILFGFCG